MDNLKIKTANITLVECLHQVAVLAFKEECFIDEIPDVLKQDLKTFLIGHTLSIKKGRVVTYDMMAYYKKIINKGFDYEIKFLHW